MSGADVRGRVPRMSFNPLRVSGTVLPPNVLLMAKLITLCFLLTGQWNLLPDHFLPFLPIFDRLGSPTLFRSILQAVFLVAALLLFINRHVRTCCLVLGAVILVGIVSSRPYYENNRMFTGCIFFLTGLYQPAGKPWLIRYQVVLVYFAAGLNKLLDLDWRSGRFFQQAAALSPQHHLYASISSLLPPMILSTLLGWLVIVTEFALAVGFLISWLYPLAIWLGIVFHTSTFVLTGRTFGMFLYAMPSSYLAFVEWPSSPMAVIDGNASVSRNRLGRLLQILDLEDGFRWVHSDAPDFELRVTDKTYRGFAALRMILLYNPLTYFAVAVILATPQPGAFRRLTAIVLLLVFSPVFIPIGGFLYNRVIDRRGRLSG